MFFPWPRRESKRSKQARGKSDSRRKPLRLQMDALEQRNLLAVSIAPPFVTVTEGNAGTTDVVLTVTLDAAEPVPVSVNFNTADGIGPSGATVVAAYELAFGRDVPVGVAIDEAVRAAKDLSTEDSGRFVNGVLGKIARELDPDQA